MPTREPTTTRFVCEAIGVDLLDPPTDRKGVQRIGAHPLCWLCGGPAGERPWLQADAIAPTFTNADAAAMPDSDTVCRWCASLCKAETFQASVAAHALPVKVWTQAGWHSYSHFVSPTAWECVKPGRVREILLDPPEPPFVLAINPSGQKHVLFRAKVITDVAMIPVQVDDQRVWVSQVAFVEVLEAFEALTALGFRKDDVLTGRYHPESTRRAGLAAWRAAEDRIAPWRMRDPQLLQLVHYCARSAQSLKQTEEAA